jgi:superfamily I DNA/RNA helicase/plasmid rolling circle replication initiator protein Rep
MFTDADATGLGPSSPVSAVLSTIALADVSPRDARWDRHKSTSEQISLIYALAESRRFERLAVRICSCSGVLLFDYMMDVDTGDFSLRLKGAVFCRFRHCSICQSRRSLMWRARFYSILPALMQQHPKARWVFLTLTVKNCPVSELRMTLKVMNQAWARFLDRRNFISKSLLGFIRATEVTRSEEGEAHPHFHCLLMVTPSYFGRQYVSHKQWLQHWRECLRVDYDPWVFVKAVKDMSIDSSEFHEQVQEVLKYSVKPADMIADSKFLLEMTNQVRGLRFMATGGVLKDIFKKAHESDPDLEDLVIGDDIVKTNRAVFESSVQFNWKRDLQQYHRVIREAIESNIVVDSKQQSVDSVYNVIDTVDGLSFIQRKVVTAPLSDMAVIAGPGSGKTRVLVSRIVHLIQHEGLSPSSVLAITFTNKAVNEIRTRLFQSLGGAAVDVWLGTFHSVFIRIIYANSSLASLSDKARILSSYGQLKVINDVLDQLNVDKALYTTQRLQNFICTYKGNFCRIAGMDYGDLDEGVLIDVYNEYQNKCNELDVLDFDEILWRAYVLFNKNPVLLDRYKDMFRYVLVDEFQDTNNIQYVLIDLLTKDRGNLFVVGDDDQSIYGWRGAHFENMNNLIHDRVNINFIRMTETYRLFSHIIGAASHLVSFNNNRFKKDLLSIRGASKNPFVYVYRSVDEKDEAKFIFDRIKGYLAKGGYYRDIAILYRNAIQSAAFEKLFKQENIPFAIHRNDIEDNLVKTDLVAFLLNSSFQFDDSNSNGIADDVIHLMTLHSSKGLEFPVVFICGLEEGTLPYRLSLNSVEKLEEERRLLYVGMTRAKDYLFLTYADRRFGNGALSSSRFLGEIPIEYQKKIKSHLL